MPREQTGLQQVIEGASAISYPWQPQSRVRGELAIGNLRQNLLKKLRAAHGIHAPTLLTFIGAITGFAAQNALWKTVTKTGQVVPNGKRGGPIPHAGFLSITVNSGEKYYFGDTLNAYLTPQPRTNRLHLWGFLAGAAAAVGVSTEALPPLNDMYAHVAQSIGSPAFGLPRVPPQHKPSVTAPIAIRTAWPFVRQVLNLPLPQQMQFAMSEPLLNEEHWPIIASIVAGQCLQSVKNAVEPRTAVVLITESAIAASKIDPTTVAATAKAA